MFLPMFPLGSVLFPSQVLPLHVFEERYRVLVADVLEGGGRFGVVLIERGHEVGGGDVRSDVGCVADVVQSHRFPDGRWALATVGVSRLRVIEWLPDDPYPRAVVEQLDETPPDDASLVELRPLANRATESLRRCLLLAAELGEPAAPPTVDLAEDLTLRSLQIGAVAPLTALDKQDLLRASGTAQRLELAERLLAQQAEILELRLGR